MSAAPAAASGSGASPVRRRTATPSISANGTPTSAASSTNSITISKKDFEPIGLISSNPQLMVAKNDLAANSLAELVTWMKANPGKINFVNQNAAANVSGVLFENLTQQKVQFIP